MIICGGRVPIQRRSNGEPTWQTLADCWFFDVEASDQQAQDGSAEDPWKHLLIVHDEPADVHRNRSDHACVMRGGSLLIMGGLYTDLIENTIYIMKDFLRLMRPADLRARRNPATLTSLKMGPDWRFDHTMVVAPDVYDVFGGRTIRSPILIYGGGGGMDIFGDLWVSLPEIEPWRLNRSQAENGTGTEYTGDRCWHQQ